MELYKKYRPRLFKHIVGQGSVTKVLQRKIKRGDLPHTILFSGPSGCGKTTLARIVAKKLECVGADFHEMNCADIRGIDMVRTIRNHMGLAPASGKCRVWCIDECHQLLAATQNAFLKILEDTPRHVYFLLCTTVPEKVIKTIRTRATSYKVRLLSDDDMLYLLHFVCEKEGIGHLTDVTFDLIVEEAQGSPRQGLVLLDSIKDSDDESEQAELLQKAEVRKQSIDLCRVLLKASGKQGWKAVSAILKELDDEAETVRRIVLKYSRTVLLGGGRFADKANLIILAFSDPFYDSGDAGLASACWSTITNYK